MLFATMHKPTSFAFMNVKQQLKLFVKVKAAIVLGKGFNQNLSLKDFGITNCKITVEL